jgi:hypothetical protein
MGEHIEKLGKAIDRPDLGDQDLEVLGKNESWGGVVAGAQVWADGTWNIRWGIKWPHPEFDGTPSACLSIRVSAMTKREKLLRFFHGNEDRSIRVEAANLPSYEVQFSKPLTSEATPEHFTDALDAVILAFAKYDGQWRWLEGTPFLSRTVESRNNGTSVSTTASERLWLPSFTSAGETNGTEGLGRTETAKLSFSVPAFSPASADTN